MIVENMGRNDGMLFTPFKLTVHSLIPGPQTFSDLFDVMKFCQSTVLCNVLHIYFLKMYLV